jgi:hypothetical protein
VSRVLDLVGRKFGRLTVVRFSHIEPAKGTTCSAWVCRCVCGNEITVRAQSLKQGHTRSCGCFASEVVGLPNAERRRYSLANDGIPRRKRDVR